MEKGKTYFVMSFLALILLFGSCTKVEKTSRKFMKEGRWCFTDLEVNGDVIDNLAKWDVYSSEEEDAFNYGTWIHSNGSTAEFLWEFNKYSGDLQFLLSPEVKYDSNKASLQCSNLTGEYAVLSNSSNLFEFESYSTTGFSGTQVYIKMEEE